MIITTITITINTTITITITITITQEQCLEVRLRGKVAHFKSKILGMTAVYSNI